MRTNFNRAAYNAQNQPFASRFKRVWPDSAGQKKAGPRGPGAGCESPIGPHGLTVRAPVAGVFADPAALAPH